MRCPEPIENEESQRNIILNISFSGGFLRIDILVDNVNSWFVEYAEILASTLQRDHICRFITSTKDILTGDILFILSCERLIKKTVRDKYNYSVVVHASDLPKGKGWSPLTWQILEGKNEIVLSMILAEDKIDSGNILLKSKINYEGTELLTDLRKKMGAEIIKMCCRFASNPNLYPGISQMGPESYYPKRGLKDSEIDITKTIEEEFNKLRVVDNERYPAFFWYKGKKYIIKIFIDGNII